eukprot:CAMPEP_0173328884 /NCGR_PEP_ID=MMETSP1144-20121109/2414_1 /TAXON_ID=483371 /ORGANISM="non described non described, Strain CCMP2298" /LENGTH=368 /DNA_ID=CAMNT_0014273445 /DNA_START=193 /DNA_END=1296 /DNA_ORIENTATION=-
MEEDVGEVGVLRDLLLQERQYRATLEEERDFLLEDNSRLRELLALSGGVGIGQGRRSGAREGTHNPHNPNHSSHPHAHPGQSVTLVRTVRAVDRVRLGIPAAHGGKNVLSVAFVYAFAEGGGRAEGVKALEIESQTNTQILTQPPHPPRPPTHHHGTGTHTHSTYNPTHEIIVSGGVDQHLRGHDITGRLLFCLPLGSPVLSLDVWGSYVACAMMGGAHAVVELKRETQENGGFSIVVGEVCVTQKHSKYVILARWSGDGNWLATVSHDKTVLLYKRSPSGSMEHCQEIRCEHTPESLCFVPSLTPPHIPPTPIPTPIPTTSTPTPTGSRETGEGFEGAEVVKKEVKEVERTEGEEVEAQDIFEFIAA